MAGTIGTIGTIGIIGSGHIGGTLAALFARAGHQVIVSNSRGPETLTEMVDSIGPQARAATAAEAAKQGDLIVVSVPLGRIKELPTKGVTGKIVIDTNNYYPQRDGQIAVLDDDTTTSCELLAVHLAGTRVVKAFNQIRWDHLRDNGRPAGSPDRLAIPIVGDDTSAKLTVAALIDEIGFDSVDLGELSRGRLFQPDGPLYVPGTTTAVIHEVVTG